MAHKKKSGGAKKKSRGQEPRVRKRPVFLPDREFFMKIQHPIGFRRDLLEASKTTLNMLKGLHGLKEIRTQKLEYLRELQREMREIKQLMQKVEEMLPKYTKKEAAKQYPHLNIVTAKISKQAKLRRVEQVILEREPAPEPVAEHRPVPAPEPVREPEPIVEKTRTELDRLNDSIADIDEKIHSLRSGIKVKKTRREELRSDRVTGTTRSKTSLEKKPLLKREPPRSYHSKPVLSAKPKSQSTTQKPAMAPKQKEDPDASDKKKKMSREIGDTLDKIHKKLKEM